jgi:hypothetical protein
MLRRLKYYGFGFGIGLIFVFLFFQNRGCSWLPGNRVKNTILDRSIVIPDIEKGIDKATILELLNDGDVNFKKSKKEGNPKVYLIEKGDKSLCFTLPTESFISEVRSPKQDISKIENSTKGFGKFIFFPNDNELVFVDTTYVLNCQKLEIGLGDSRMIFKRLKETGKIDFSKSNFNLKPKPEHFLIFEDKKGREIGVKTDWYKNKINIHFFELPFESTCL